MVFETKEQIIKRKRMARYRFKAIARKAQFNSYWLLDDIDIDKNVPKNVAVLLKRFKERRGVLTLQEKSLLRKSSAARTKEDFKHLEKLFDELPCFKEFSPVSFFFAFKQCFNLSSLSR